MSATPRHSVSVSGVAVDEAGRALLIRRRDNGRWEPPGGVLELDETIKAGAQREVLEETGVLVHIEQLTGVYKNMQLGVVALVFRARAVRGEPAPTDEAQEVRWLTRDEITACVPAVYALRVLDALDTPSQPRIAHHDGNKFEGPTYAGSRQAHQPVDAPAQTID